MVTFRTGLGTVVFGWGVVLMLLLPFELAHPLFRLVGMGFTNLEIWALGTLALWWLSRGYAMLRGISSLPAGLRRQLSLLGLWLLAGVLSALQAPAYQGAALKFMLRLAIGVMVFLFVYDIARTPKLQQVLLGALTLGALVAAFLGFGELLNWPGVMAFIERFRTGPATVGGHLRLTGPFIYATVASMYFEMVIPLIIALGVLSKRRWAWWGTFIAAGACTLAVLGTQSRAGVITLGLILLGLVSLGLLWQQYRPLSMRAAGLLLILVAGVTTGIFLSPVMRARWKGTEGSAWFGARYEVPASLRVTAGTRLPVTVRVHNTGQTVWLAEGRYPFVLEVRWLTADGQRVFTHWAAAFRLPRDVPPGDSIVFQVFIPVRLPPGQYRIAWGMAQEGRLAFRHWGIPEAETLVEVQPNFLGLHFGVPPTLPFDRSVYIPAIPPRKALWQVAWRMVIERPLFGVGPDNFRRLYGRYLGMKRWDERVHANSLYLEMLAGFGVVGITPFFMAMAVGFGYLVRRWRRDERGSILNIGALASLAAFFVHGLVDAFLAFYATAWLFWTAWALAHRAAEVGAARS